MLFIAANTLIVPSVGFDSGLGEVADGINAAWYAADGDWTNAALSAAAMVSGLGWGATPGQVRRQVWRQGRRPGCQLLQELGPEV